MSRGKSSVAPYFKGLASLFCGLIRPGYIPLPFMVEHDIWHAKKTQQQTQRQAFIDAARKAECDESEAVWEGKLRRIVKAKRKATGKKKSTK